MIEKAKLLLLLLSLVFDIQAKIVSTSYGKLEGAVIESEDRNKKYMFKNIPFASPPIGELRFELPQPPKPWEGIRNAANYSAACPSWPKNLKKLKYHIPDNMDEDCLYLNIFTSEKCMNSSCHVIIYYHGGSFNLDSATMFNDTFILERYVAEDIVFVIPAFRIGTFGLFYLGTEDLIHQNIPLHDCNQSLHFIHDEISNFGGDRDNINLMGHSSGAQVVALFGASPYIDPDQKLFKKMIVFSAPQIYTRPELTIQNSYRIAEKVGCFSPNNTRISQREIINCMKKVSSFDLLKNQHDMEEEGKFVRLLQPGLPCMGPDESRKHFMTSLRPRKMLIGGTVDESGYHTDVTDNPTISGNFWDFENPYEMAEYFNNFQKEVNNKSGSVIPESTAEAIFVPNAIYSAAMVRNGGEVYLFQSNQQPVSTHVSDLQYFIGYHREAIHTSDMDILDSFYSKMIVNFTKFGEPSPNWKPLDPSKMNYYAVEVDTKRGIWPKMEENYRENDVNFWLINMSSYDRELTKTKTEISMSTPIILKSEAFSISNIFTQWYFYGFLVLVAVTLGFLIYFWPRNKPAERQYLLN